MTVYSRKKKEKKEKKTTSADSYREPGLAVRWAEKPAPRHQILRKEKALLMSRQAGSFKSVSLIQDWRWDFKGFLHWVFLNNGPTLRFSKVFKFIMSGPLVLLRGSR